MCQGTLRWCLQAIQDYGWLAAGEQSHSISWKPTPTDLMLLFVCLKKFVSHQLHHRVQVGLGSLLVYWILSIHFIDCWLDICCDYNEGYCTSHISHDVIWFLTWPLAQLGNGLMCWMSYLQCVLAQPSFWLTSLYIQMYWLTQWSTDVGLGKPSIKGDVIAVWMGRLYRGSWPRLLACAYDVHLSAGTVAWCNSTSLATQCIYP